MKTIVTLLVAFMVSATVISQNQFMNYKAVVKDGSGNIVASSLISVKIEILIESNVVYTETHDNVMTDDNGIMGVEIGSGDTTDDFASVNWNRYDYRSIGPGFKTNSLKVGIDLSNGTSFVDMGTSEFKSVPYAYNVINGGLYREGDGWRLEDNFWPDGEIILGPGNWAIDMTEHKDDVVSNVSGASGNWSFAAGRNNLASGEKSVAFGNNNQAIGNGSVAFGQQNHSGGEYSMTHGHLNNWQNISGDYSIAFGHGLKTEAFHSMAIGRFNTGTGDPLNWVGTDPIFEIGNGTSTGSRSNALTILKNGTIIAPTITNADINTAGNKAMVTKEYVDTMSGAGTGLEAIDEGNGIGWRLIGRNPADYSNIGHDAIDFSTSFGGIIPDAGASGSSSFAMGVNNAVTGSSSMALGFENRADGNSSLVGGFDSRAAGDYSFAIGNDAQALSEGAVAFGLESRANGSYSLATGINSYANGPYSVAFNGTADGNSSFAFRGIATGTGSFAVGGEAIGSNSIAFGGTKVSGDGSMAVGTYNVDNINAAFMVGNGTASNARNNALQVLKNGNIQYGSVEYIKDGGGFTTEINGGLYPVSDGSSNLGSATNRWNTIYATNGTIQTSDRRDKTNIQILEYGLNQVMQLQPISFNWKRNPDEDTKLGLVAQDLLQVIPEVVKTHAWVNTNENDRTQKERVMLDRMGVNYSDLVPVLIKAIQEQQTEIESLLARIEALENR